VTFEGAWEEAVVGDWEDSSVEGFGEGFEESEGFSLEMRSEGDFAEGRFETIFGC